MSLINDALRRAKEADQQEPLPPAEDLPFRPIEAPQPRTRRGLGLLMPIALAGFALLALMFAWFWTQTRGAASPMEVNARMARVQPAALPAPAVAPTPEPVAAPVTDAASTAAVAANATSTPADQLPASVEETPVTNAPAVAEPAPPKPAPLRLQAIIYNPSRPSAMIGGRTLFVGDKVGDLRVAAIDKDSATLTGAGTTNVLSLAE